MKFGKKSKELPKVEPVKIKPLFGLKPGLWLTIAYALIILAIIFAVCMLPDIINGSKRVTFTSDAGTFTRILSRPCSISNGQDIPLRILIVVHFEVIVPRFTLMTMRTTPLTSHNQSLLTL